MVAQVGPCLEDRLASRVPAVSRRRRAGPVWFGMCFPDGHAPRRDRAIDPPGGATLERASFSLAAPGPLVGGRAFLLVFPRQRLTMKVCRAGLALPNSRTAGQALPDSGFPSAGRP